MKLLSKKTKKAFIIGIDGAPYSLIMTYLKHGILPNLKKILEQGHLLSQMNASIPDISSVSWTSFNTGVNPGEHGIYGFTDLRPKSYALYFPNSRDIQAPTLWEILAQTSKNISSLSQRYHKRINRSYRSIILNVPHTYPAWPMNGILVSGFVSIDLKKAIFPESIFSYLQSIDYLIDVDAEKAKEDKTAFIKSLFECFEIRKKAIFHFFEETSWDLFFACITETDRLHHFFFDASQDQGNPYHEPFVRFYIELDQFMGQLYERFIKRSQEKGFFMILSDHGFAPIKQEVYINSFLREKGFLVLKDEGEFYEKIGDQTKAFCLDPCRIYLHRKEAYPRGRVKNEEREEVLKDIQESMKTLRGRDGEEVIDKIYRKEEIYQGPYFSQAPDLVCLPKEGYDLKGSLEKREIFGKNIFTGMHTWHDAFFVCSEDLSFSQKPSIDQLTERVIQYFT